MPEEAVLDEELLEGLKGAKKGPRNFVLVIKGQKPVKLLVRKKKVREAEAMKLKTDAKGTDFLVGVLEASGSDFAFMIAGTAEPGVNILKLKELIDEQTELTAKPRWQLVPALPDIDEGDDEAQQRQQLEVDAARRKKELADALKALATPMQQIMVREPAQRDNILNAAAKVKAALAQNNLDEAALDLTALKELLALAAKGGAAPVAAAAQAPVSKLSIAKLGKARLEWITVHSAAVKDIARLKQAIDEEFQDDADQATELAAALAEIDAIIKRLDTRLADELDDVLNGTDGTRPDLIARARKTIESLTRLCESDPIVAALDDNEVIPGFSVVAPMRAKLGEISAALG